MVFLEGLERILWNRLPDGYQPLDEFKWTHLLTSGLSWQKCSTIAQDITRRTCGIPELDWLALSVCERAAYGFPGNATPRPFPFENSAKRMPFEEILPRFCPSVPWYDTQSVDRSLYFSADSIERSHSSPSYQDCHKDGPNRDLKLPGNPPKPEDFLLKPPFGSDDFLSGRSHTACESSRSMPDGRDSCHAQGHLYFVQSTTLQRY